MEIHHVYNKAIGFVCDSQSPGFSDKDLQAFHIKRSEIENDAKDLMCYQHALLQSREMRAHSFIFMNDTSLLSKYSNIISVLTKWKYEPITLPQERDLAVYLNGNQPTHTGVYATAGKVISKFGKIPYVYTHNLFSVFEDYSNKVSFFRKPQAYEEVFSQEFKNS